MTWPPLLGTGGNDGRLDFTNNLMQRLGDLFEVTEPNGRAKPTAPSLLSHALWGVAAKNLSAAAVGQFQPGSAAGRTVRTAQRAMPL